MIKNLIKYTRRVSRKIPYLDVKNPVTFLRVPRLL